jgi:hypothetical protein
MNVLWWLAAWALAIALGVPAAVAIHLLITRVL